MFKKLFICLTLIAMLFISPIAGVYAMEEGQECTIIKNAKIIQILPDRSFRGVISPAEVIVTVGAKLTPVMASKLNRISGEINWNGGYMGLIEVDFGNGLIPLLVVVRPEYVKDCK